MGVVLPHSLKEKEIINSKSNLYSYLKFYWITSYFKPGFPLKKFEKIREVLYTIF